MLFACVLQSIAISVSSTLEEPAAEAASTQQTPHQPLAPRRPLPSTRRFSHKSPDPAAVSRWMADEDGLEPAEAVAMGVAGAAAQPQLGLGPRIRADPMLQAQQLAGWVRVVGDGAVGEAGQAGEPDAAMGMEEGHMAPGADEHVAEEEDMMDEEEWI